MYIFPADFDIETLAPGEAVAVDWSAERYHSDRQTLSRSDLLWLAKDPEGFATSRFGPGHEAESRESNSMNLGTLVHTRLLEPERWFEKLAPPRRRPAGWIGTQKAYDRHRKIVIEHCPGAIDPTDKTRERVEQIAARVRQHEFARTLLDLPGHTELTIIWREPETEIPCRVRLDKVGELPDGALAVPDLKTAREVRPSEFAKSIREHGYHVQAALYSDALAALCPAREVIYGIIAVRNRRPHKVGAWPMATRAIEKGREVYMAALRDYKERTASGDWLEAWEHDYSREIDLPEWEYKGRK